MTKHTSTATRILRLSGDGDMRTVRVLSSEVSIGEGARRTWVTVTRTGSFTDPRYGRFEITPKMLAEMVRNFEAGVIGTDIFLDVSHKPDDGAAAKLLRLVSDGTRLRAEVEWTAFGLSAVRERGFRYLSAEFAENWRDNEEGKTHGTVLLGAGLTIRPVIKRLDPVMLAVSDDHSGPVYVLPGLARTLTESLETIAMNRWKQFVERCKKAGISLSEALWGQIRPAYEAATKHLAEGDDAEGLDAQFETVAKTLAEVSGEKSVQLSVNAPAVKVDEAAVAEQVRKALAEREEQTRKLATTREERVKLFSDTLTAAQGLSEDTRKTLGEASDLITAEMTEDHVRKLAQTQIALGNQLEAARKLSTLGFARPAGQVHVAVDDGNEIRKLSAQIREGLVLSGATIKAPEPGKETGFVKRVMDAFDAAHAPRLLAERKALADGAVNIGDTQLPASFQREVLREALSDLNFLNLVNARVEITAAATHNIPYEVRDGSAIRNNGVVYEGQPIHKAGVSQQMDLAYIQPMKLALELTNEVMHFTANNPSIDWDAYGRNLSSNARFIRELMARRIANEMQRSSDTFGAVAVSNEALTAQVNGTRDLFKTAQWPVLRPHQERDLQGNAVGSPEHAVAVSYDSNAISEFDGSGDQPAGTYYRWVNLNLGFIQLVDQTGAVVTPPNTTPLVVSYSYATNVKKFDLDVPANTTRERHLNGLLQAIGNRKAVMDSERFVKPDFAIMSSVLHNEVTDAEQFSANFQRPDADISATGDLGPVKGVGAWATNGPGIDLGDERILLGLRGNFWYTIGKTFATGVPFEVFDSQGRPLGKKAAYGEEYSSIKVPGPRRGYYSSVIAYSASARTAV